jgi:hypothetical protein
MTERRDIDQTNERFEVSVVEAQSRAEIDIQIATAKHYPRNVQKVYSSALQTVESSREIAEACFYTLPRGGKNIVGPSVRLAEIMATNWGNLRVKTTIVDEGRDSVICQATCIDLETNVGVSTEVRRRITDSKGKRFNDDMITVTTNAASAIAFRNSVFKVIPGVFVQPIFERARQLAVGKETELDSRRAKCVKYFESLGVPATILLKHLGKLKVNDIKLEDIEYLLGVQNALKEGETSAEDVFQFTRDGKPMDPAAAGGKGSLNEVAEQAKAKAKTKTPAKAKAEAPAEPIPDENGEIPDDGEGLDEIPFGDPDEPPSEPEPANADDPDALLC